MRIALAFLLLATPAAAADLARPLAPAPAVVVGPPGLCLTAAPVEVYRAPEDEANGILPAGLLVAVVEEGWSPLTDLWVRVRPPRDEQNYGWVETRTLVCR